MFNKRWNALTLCQCQAYQISLNKRFNTKDVTSFLSNKKNKSFWLFFNWYKSESNVKKLCLILWISVCLFALGWLCLCVCACFVNVLSHHHLQKQNHQTLRWYDKRINARPHIAILYLDFLFIMCPTIKLNDVMGVFYEVP